MIYKFTDNSAELEQVLNEMGESMVYYLQIEIGPPEGVGQLELQTVPHGDGNTTLNGLGTDPEVADEAVDRGAEIYRKRHRTALENKQANGGARGGVSVLDRGRGESAE